MKWGEDRYKSSPERHAVSSSQWTQGPRVAAGPIIIPLVINNNYTAKLYPIHIHNITYIYLTLTGFLECFKRPRYIYITYTHILCDLTLTGFLECCQRHCPASCRSVPPTHSRATWSEQTFLVLVPFRSVPSTHSRVTWIEKTYAISLRSFYH